MNEQEQVNELKNDSVCVHYMVKPGCVIKASILVSEPACIKAHEEALKHIKKQISIPGFRKGKVPDEVVLQRFSPQVEEKEKNLILTTAFHETATLVPRQPLGSQPILKMKLSSLNSKKRADVFLEYEVSPEVPTVDFSGIHIEKVEPRTVTQTDFDKELLRIRLIKRTRGETLTHPVEVGDFVTASLTYFDTDFVTPSEKKDFFVNRDSLAGWFLDAIVGMNISETKEIISHDEPTHRKCRITIENIQSGTLPEVNDEFAKSVGAKSVQELTTLIWQRLEYQAKLAAYELMRASFKKELIRLYAFDLPRSLIDKETSSRMKPYLDYVQGLGITCDETSVKKRFLDEVKRYFTYSLLFRPIALQEQLPVYQNELLVELLHQSMEAPFYQRSVYPGIDFQTTQQRIFLDILQKKCEEFCLKKHFSIELPVQPHPEKKPEVQEPAVQEPEAQKLEAQELEAHKQETTEDSQKQDPIDNDIQNGA